MKQLTLIRHAKSSWKHPELADFDRPLNKRGKKDLPDMTERIYQSNLHPDLLLSSGARRAVTTANAVASRLKLKPEQFQIIPELYESSSETLLYTLQNLPDKLTHVMLVGHNPGLEMLIHFLTQNQLEKFPTAAVFSMHLSIAQWAELAEGCATPILFDYPKKHLTAT
ncbi:MAG: phosphoglycerate mutase [Neptuniibacter caesariensis]|uniref:Phosphoglycerate mutase n=1 Tax=Neptuniibacter caesariensis TaxID=207954 RepID=A0A2G6JLC9_NEPCE|nr:MAG: phosphoglycerate mutase [Neptuniibacter caesariensis]